MFFFPVPGIPLNLNVIVSSSSSLNVSWNPPADLNGPSISYFIRYSNDNSVNLTEELIVTEISIDNLEPFNPYSVSVQACSSVGCSDFTEAINRITGEAGELLSYSNLACHLCLGLKISKHNMPSQ